MSKLYKKYLELKKTDSSKIYLFKSGLFYIFIEDDAYIMSKFLNLHSLISKLKIFLTSSDNVFS